MPIRPKNLDLSQLAKRIVEEASGEAEKMPPPPEKSPSAVRAGALGGQKGAAKRAASLTLERRQAIAKKAAAKRWKP